MKTYQEPWPRHLPPPHPANIALQTSSREDLQPLGTVYVRVYFKQRSKELPLLTMSGTGCNLLAQYWFDPLGISLDDIHQVLEEQSLVAIREYHSILFDGDLSSFKGPAVTLELEVKPPPKFLRTRSVPFALRDQTSRQNGTAAPDRTMIN